MTTETPDIPKRSASKAKASPKIKEPANNAQKLMLAKVETSVLDATDAKLLKFKVADPLELAGLEFPVKAAFELPYFDAKGKPTGFKRWRYLEDTRSAFAQQNDAKPMRYIQAGDTVCEVYLPPLPLKDGMTWAQVQQDNTIILVITEGELKAACCCKYSYPCIGLGGVYSFKSKKRKLPLLPMFYEFVWENRAVLIAYDSDAHSNPMVVRARNELCKELLALGAIPYIVNVETGPEGEKRGLDDIAYYDGPEALCEVLEDRSEAYSMAKELHALNIEVAYIKNPGMVITMDTGLKMRPSDFTGHAYSTRHFWEEVPSGKDGGTKSMKKKAAPAWLEWPYRLELEGIVYQPGYEQITEQRKYNTWPGWGCAPKKGSVKPWTDLLDHLFKGYPTERDWFERWCALPIQQPGMKMYTAAVLWGVATGTGKSLVGYSLSRIYGKNFTEISDAELTDERNEWAVEKQFVMGDDVASHDQRKAADRLKKMITQLKMRIDQKYVPSYEVIDVINYLFTSNHPDAFFLEDDDRRNFIHEVREGPLSSEFYVAYMEWLNSDGPSALFFHLLNLDLKDLRAESRAPKTDSRQAMLEDGLSSLGIWVRTLKVNPDQVLRVGDVVLKGDLWSSADLFKVFNPMGTGRVTAITMSKELKRAGFRQAYSGMPVRTISAGQTRLFVIRNQVGTLEGWVNHANTKMVAEHYDETRGGIKPKGIPELPKKKKKY
jgi:hypothetical protein